MESLTEPYADVSQLKGGYMEFLRVRLKESNLPTEKTPDFEP